MNKGSQHLTLLSSYIHTAMYVFFRWKLVEVWQFLSDWLGPAGTGATRGYALEFRFGGQLCHAYPPSFIRALPLSLRTLSPEPSHKHSISIKLTLFKGLTGYRYSTIVTSGLTVCLFFSFPFSLSPCPSLSSTFSRSPFKSGNKFTFSRKKFCDRMTRVENSRLVCV